VRSVRPVAQADTTTHQRCLHRDGVLAGHFAIGTIAIRPLDKSAAVESIADSSGKPLSQEGGGWIRSYRSSRLDDHRRHDVRLGPFVEQ
jgi:hypothetical protein